MAIQNERQITEEQMWLLHRKLTEHFLSLLEKGDAMRASAYKEVCDFLYQNGITLKEKPPTSPWASYGIPDDLPFPGNDEVMPEFLEENGACTPSPSMDLNMIAPYGLPFIEIPYEVGGETQ